MMNKTPEATIPHIAILGDRNVGKSSLINAITNQQVSIVSSVKGTTTDPVKKRMEFLPYGPVVLIDTAGVDDEGELGRLRVEATKKVLQRTDLAIIVCDITCYSDDSISDLKRQCKRYAIPYLLVFNKCDTVTSSEIELIKSKYKEAQFISTKDEDDILDFKSVIIEQLEKEKEETILGDLLPMHASVILVVPIDSEAPKGRIILPQVQVIRDCLDHGIKSYVVRDTELEGALMDLKKVDLVITDSQAFHSVSQIVPSTIPLTSFSILFSRFKGDLPLFLEGVYRLKNLKDGSKVLIAESCSHNVSHEDIGRYKIPMLIQKKLNKTIEFTHFMGHDYPDNLSQYDLIIHCGSCMLNKKTMQTRMQLAKEANVPITNYGIALAFLMNILDRSVEVFKNK